MDYYKNDCYWVKAQSFLPEDNRLTIDTMPNEYFLPVSEDLEIHIDHYKPASPSGKVILFHGVGGNGRLLSFIAVPLMKNGFEVICPDMPLYGCTHFSRPVTYETWISCGSSLVKHFQEENPLPTFLFGLSAGGMLAYQVANESSQIAGLIVTCILDQRNKAVLKSSARNPFLGMIARPIISMLSAFDGNIKVPMKWVGNMKAIANDKRLVNLLIQDKKSSGALVPIKFLYSMLNPKIKIEPQHFNNCPVLLVHPGEDRWTNIRLSKTFYDRLACEKETVILEGAGHFPIEGLGLKQMEIACVEFIKQQLVSL